MKEKTDPRVIRTKKLMRDALLKLINDKGADRVTVSELAKEAGVNRGTFYLHYRDVPDMLDQIKAEIFEGFDRVFRQLNPQEVGRYARRGEAYPGTLRVLEYFARNADFFRVILGPNGDPSFERQIKTYMKEHLFDVIFPERLREKLEPLPVDYLIAYVLSANIGLVIHWLESGMRLPAEEVAALLTRFMAEGPLRVAGLAGVEGENGHASPFRI